MIEDNLWVYVYYSDKEDFEKDWKGYRTYPWILMRLLNKPYFASEFWNDHLKDSKADIFMYFNDDVIMEIHSLLQMTNIMETFYPDLDGVVGFTQQNLPENQCCKAAFGAIGSKFIERFPDRKVFCEDFKRMFLDKELELYSSKIGKLYFDYEKGPKLIHRHPCFNKEEHDSTHDDVRKWLRGDQITFNKRQSRGLLWGIDFNLINENT